MARLNLPWRSNGDAVVCIVVALIGIGLVNVFSSSMVLASQTMGDSYYFLKRQAVSLVIGLILGIIAMCSDYRRWRPLVPLLLLVTLTMLLVVLYAGVDVNGARRWMRLLSWQFQPSEVAKLVTVLVTAGYLAPYIKRGRTVSVLSLPLVAAALMAVLIYKEPDMGTAAMVVALTLLVFMVAGVSRRQVVITGLLCLVLAGGLSVRAAYRAERVYAWLNPWAYQADSGYQSVQAMLAIGSGGIWGVGPGLGVSKFYYLPEAHTDFAFAVFCEEFGFLGAMVVLLLFAALAWYGSRIAVAAPDGYGLLLGAGLTALIAGEAWGNIAMVTNLLPVTGVPLPFISYGGTALMVNLIAVGILLSINRCSQRAVRRLPHAPAPLETPAAGRRPPSA